MRLASAQWEALGSTVVLRLAEPGAGEPDAMIRARTLVERELAAIDRACSRFRVDSDLSRVNALAGGRPVPVAPPLIEALLVALRAARLTDGDVDPTIGAALALAGYDRDWALLTSTDAATPHARGTSPLKASRAARTTPEPARGEAAPCERAAGASAGGVPPRPAGGAPPTVIARRRRGYRTVVLDPDRGTVRVPRGVALDLGATAKAWAADRCARAVHTALGCGALVSLGGDVATAGRAPTDGWRIHVTDDHRAGPDAPGQTVTIAAGGLATSSTTVRRWRRGGAELHHIIDPARGAPARGPWRTVSVAAADCADANIAATAALVRGARAPEWLARLGLPARLVAHDGAVLRVGGWPAAVCPAPPPGEDSGLPAGGLGGSPTGFGGPASAPPADRRSAASARRAPTSHADDPPP